MTNALAWLGRSSQSDEHYIADGEDIFRARTIRRLNRSDRYEKELLEKVVATPWATKGVGKQPTPDFVLRGGLPGREKVSEKTKVDQEQSGQQEGNEETKETQVDAKMKDDETTSSSSSSSQSGSSGSSMTNGPEIGDSEMSKNYRQKRQARLRSEGFRQYRVLLSQQLRRYPLSVEKKSR